MAVPVPFSRHPAYNKHRLSNEREVVVELLCDARRLSQASESQLTACRTAEIGQIVRPMVIEGMLARGGSQPWRLAGLPGTRRWLLLLAGLTRQCCPQARLVRSFLIFF
jgi:hypothetical protein